MSKNYTMEKIRDKVDKGQFLDDAEKQYLDLEAGNAVDGVIGRWQGRGAGFVLHMAKLLEKRGQELREKELGRARKETPKPATHEPQHNEADHASDGGIFGNVGESRLFGSDFYGRK